ncbi:MAG TPA: MlaD family protein [Chthoniobacterales bacterium]|nr:MlaD family protein [Chthoniobacterales bacterium]
MQLQRNEVLTGLLVLATIAVLTFVLILLGAPGLFHPLVTYRIYMDNANGIKQGAPVLLAGRKIGQVDKLYSPVSKEEAAKAVAAAEALHAGDPIPTPADKPKYEARIDVKVDRNAFVYRDAHARLITLGLLGEVAIDITQGNDTSGRANDGEIFAGERVPDFGESISKMLDIVKPVATEATNTLKELQVTAQNLSRITDENSQLNMGLAQFRTFVENLTSLTARDSSLSIALANIEKISTDLSSNDNIKITLQNFRESSEKLKGVMDDVSNLGPDLKASGTNVKELTETVKTQPWRLIWPSTKKYPQNEQAAAETTPTKRTTKPPRHSTSPTPPPRTR